MQFLPPKWARTTYLGLFFAVTLAHVLFGFVRDRTLDWEHALRAGCVVIGVLLFLRLMALPWFASAETWRDQWRGLRLWRKAGVWGIGGGVVVFLLLFLAFVAGAESGREGVTLQVGVELLFGTMIPVDYLLKLRHGFLAPLLGSEYPAREYPVFPGHFVAWVLDWLSWLLIVAYWFAFGVLAFTVSRLIYSPIRRFGRA